MNEKPKSIYLFVVIISLLIFGLSSSIIIFATFEITTSLIILGIIVFITVLFFISIANKLNTDGFKTKMANKIVCPSCGTLVSKDDTYCHKCGTNIEGTIECDYCSYQNPFDSEICEKCGGILK